MVKFQILLCFNHPEFQRDLDAEVMGKETAKLPALRICKYCYRRTLQREYMKHVPTFYSSSLVHSQQRLQDSLKTFNKAIAKLLT